MITYRELSDTRIGVYLEDGRKAGVIHRNGAGWTYVPRGTKCKNRERVFNSDVFADLGSLKQSLEVA